jgi:TetR/AcrR family transcriptional regulator, ethionamide resistance regulator
MIYAKRRLSNIKARQTFRIPHLSGSNLRVYKPKKFSPSGSNHRAQPERSRPKRRPRRRRRPEDAEHEILEAAEAFLRERPFHEMTVDELMTRTGLSRPSFYEYFRDRHDLIVKLVERLNRMINEVAERWKMTRGDPRAELRRAFTGLIHIYRDHGHLLRALAAAAPQDREVAEAYEKLLAKQSEGTARRIRADVKSRRTKPLNVEGTARALIVMNAQYLAETFRSDRSADTRAAAEVLTAIWMRVLYGAPR